MPRKCKHENVDHLMPGEVFRPHGCVDGVHAKDCGLRVAVQQLRCLDCSAWLSLGHSDETEERIAIEIRAAEIAERPIIDETTRLEEYGWLGTELIPELLVVQRGKIRRDLNVPLDVESAQWQAGYLARCIVEHKEGES